MFPRMDGIEIARHEAGHAVACYLLGVKVFSIEMIAGEGLVYHDGPDTLLGAGKDAASVGIVHGKIAVAGKAASPSTEYSATDNDGVRMAHWLSGIADVDWLTFRDACHDLVAKLLSEHEPKVACVAAAVMARGALSGDEFLKLIEAPDANR